MDYIAKICQNDIIHFQKIFHCKPSSYWGTSLYGNLHIKPLIKPEALMHRFRSAASRRVAGTLEGGVGAAVHSPLQGVPRDEVMAVLGLGMTSNCCRECNDLYMIILYSIAHRSGRLPGSLYFLRVK